MNYQLQIFDTPLIRFSLEYENLKGIVCSVLWSDDSNAALFPIGMQFTDAGVLSWLRSRTIPKNRHYVQSILASMQLRENDLIGLLNVCMGLSLNDSYWVVPEGFSGTFAEYNLYDNDFSKALSLIAYVGHGSVRARGFTSSPEFTTNGMLRKGWRRIGGQTLLYKGGTEGASNAGNEPFSEFYAAQIANAMGLNHVPYSLASWKKSICSVCPLFTDKEHAYVPIWRFGEFTTIVDIADYLKSLGDSFFEDFVDMMVFDALIYNTDRHQGNFGLLVDLTTNKPYALAPIFDNGLGLFPYAVQEDIENLNAYAQTRSSAFQIPFDEIVQEYISDRQRKQLRKVLTFRFERDRNYNLSAKRIRALESFIQGRARQLLEM